MKLPHKISYTRAVKGGDANMCFIRIEPKYKDDAGLHAHEYEHVKQWYRTLFVLTPLQVCLLLVDQYTIWFLPFFLLFHNFAYRWVRKYRQYCEVRSLKAQIATYEHNWLDGASKRLATKYDLGITFATARILLTK